MTVLVVVVAGVIAVVLVIKVMWGRRRRVTNNDDAQGIEMEVVPAPQPAVASAPPIVDAGAGASGGTSRRIPTTDRPVLKKSNIFGRKKKVEVVQGKKITSSCCCCHVSN